MITCQIIFEKKNNNNVFASFLLQKTKVIDVREKDGLPLPTEENDHHHHPSTNQSSTPEHQLEEWRAIARVLDRLFFIFYMIISPVVTMIFFGILIDQQIKCCCVELNVSGTRWKPIIPTKWRLSLMTLLSINPVLYMRFEKLDWTELMSVHSKINFVKLKMGISNFIQMTYN